jgi:hypothetical protein
MLTWFKCFISGRIGDRLSQDHSEAELCEYGLRKPQNPGLEKKSLVIRIFLAVKHKSLSSAQMLLLQPEHLLAKLQEVVPAL